MDSLKFQTLEILVEEGNPTCIKWRGVSKSREPGSVIGPFFEKLATELKGVHAVVDFTELEFMNSSTVSPIVKFCQLFNKNSIKTTLKYDKESAWQSATFKALTTLSRVMEHVTVEPISRS